MLILIALCPGCRWSIGNPAEGQLPQRTGAPAGNYITLPIDSFRHYPLLTDGKSFVRMLKAEKNRLWHFNSRNLLELINLADTAAARPVALPERFANLVYSERDVVAEDGPDGGLWICNYSRGLLRYSARDGVFRPSPLGSCGSLYVLDNYVAVADIQHGLIVLNKAMEILDTITDFPLHQIHDVRETGRFGLVINGCRYDPQDGKLEKITRIGEVELPDGSRAQVAAISADTDPGSQTLRVRATLEGNSGFLPGQQFSVILWLDAPEGSVTIPSSALVTSSSGQAVFRLDEGQIGRVAIDHDLGGDDRIRVVQASGLAPGMDVVTSGTSTLKSMIPAE